jgi:hypothetical protein
VAKNEIKGEEDGEESSDSSCNESEVLRNLMETKKKRLHKIQPKSNRLRSTIGLDLGQI